MRWLLALLCLLVASPAAALTTSQAGILATASGGGTLDAGATTTFSPGWTAGAAIWWGRYDEVYALGRFTSLGITLRQAWHVGTLETIPALELRRGNDVLVVGYHAFLSVGPVLRGGAVGGEALLGGGVKWRFLPKLGLLLRVGGGAAWVDGRWSGRALVRLGLEAATPFAHRGK